MFHSHLFYTGKVLTAKPQKYVEDEMKQNERKGDTVQNEVK